MKRAPRYGLLYVNHGHTNIKCFFDANWARLKVNMRSTIRYYVFIGGNLVSWRSKKQNVVSWSSVESKYRAMVQLVHEIMWLHQLLNKVSLKSSTTNKAMVW